MLTEDSRVYLSKSFGAMEADEQAQVAGAEASLPHDMCFRVYFKTRLSFVLQLIILTRPVVQSCL